MRLYYPVDLAGNVNTIEKLVLGGTGTGDRAFNGPGRAGPGRHSNYLQRAGPNIRTGRAGPENSGLSQFFLLVFITVVFKSIFFISITVFISKMLKGETCFK